MPHSSIFFTAFPPCYEISGVPTQYCQCYHWHRPSRLDNSNHKHPARNSCFFEPMGQQNILNQVDVNGVRPALRPLTTSTIWIVRSKDLIGSSRFKWLRRAGTTKLSTVHTVGQGPTLVTTGWCKGLSKQQWQRRMDVSQWGNPNSLWHCQRHLSGQIHKSVCPHYFPTVFHLIFGWLKPIKPH